jgi:hypothetical protein
MLIKSSLLINLKILKIIKLIKNNNLINFKILLDSLLSMPKEIAFNFSES